MPGRQFLVAGFGGEITLSEDNRDLVLQYSRIGLSFHSGVWSFFRAIKYYCFTHRRFVGWIYRMENIVGSCLLMKL